MGRGTGMVGMVSCFGTLGHHRADFFSDISGILPERGANACREVAMIYMARV